MLIVTREGDRRCKLPPAQRAIVALVYLHEHTTYAELDDVPSRGVADHPAGLLVVRGSVGALSGSAGVARSCPLRGGSGGGRRSTRRGVRTARRVTRRLSAAGLGKTCTTSVLRLISRVSRSRGLVDWIFFQCWRGRIADAVRSSFASRNISLTLGNCSPSMSATVSSWVRTSSVAGWAKMVRIVAATISPVPLGRCVKQLRRKCTRQRW